MIVAGPIRERTRPPQAKCFRMCTYTTSRDRDFLSPVESADTKLLRICTFYSYLKSRSFNRYGWGIANSFRMCTYITRGGGGWPGRLNFRLVSLLGSVLPLASNLQPRAPTMAFPSQNKTASASRRSISLFPTSLPPCLLASLLPDLLASQHPTRMLIPSVAEGRPDPFRADPVEPERSRRERAYRGLPAPANGEIEGRSHSFLASVPPCLPASLPLCFQTSLLPCLLPLPAQKTLPAPPTSNVLCRVWKWSYTSALSH